MIGLDPFPVPLTTQRGSCLTIQSIYRQGMTISFLNNYFEEVC